MKGIGSKIKDIRRHQGLSQEELADLAKLNLRTIQRVENNSNQPNGKTIKLLCNALNINIEDIVEYGKTEDNTFLILFHLSVLSFMVLPLGNIIVPMILWLTKKDRIVGLKEAGANLLNYQIIWTGFFYLAIVIGVLGKLSHNSFKYFLYVIAVLVVINIIIPIVFAFLINQKSKNVFYPKMIKIIS